MTFQKDKGGKIFMKPEYSTAQTKMHILRMILLGEKPSDTFKPPKSREDPVKDTDMLHFCKGFGVTIEGRDKESRETQDFTA